MKNALLLINIGTPDRPDKAAVRSYLHQFLADPWVLDLPTPLRYLLLYGFILPLRPSRSAKAYQAIWEEAGSPLLINSLKLQEKLQSRLQGRCEVALGMRYGSPSIESALAKLGPCENLYVLPLYPQFSNAATLSSLDKTFQTLLKQKHFPASCKIVRDFYTHPSFIEAQVQAIRPHLGEQEFLLFSYHGLPVRQLHNAGCDYLCKGSCPAIDLHNQTCYKAQCQASTEAIAQALQLKPEEYGLSFQSRLGKTLWIRPITEEVILELAKKGIKHLAITCPSFVADCLETLEEIGIRAREQWLKAGGSTLTLLPCLNDDDRFVEAIIEICGL